MEKERDNLATQLGAAYYTHEDLKRENEALQLENETLRDEIDSLRLDKGRSDKETKHLMNEVMNMKIDFEEQTNQWARREAILRQKKGKAPLRDVGDDDEFADGIDVMTGQSGASKDPETRQWRTREARLRSKIEEHNDTIKLLQRTTEEKAINYLREEITKLRAQLSQHNAERQDWSKKINFKETDLRRELNQAIIEHQEESDKWAGKEAQLMGKISKREEAVRQLQLPTAEEAHAATNRRRTAQKHSRIVNAGFEGKSAVERGQAASLSQQRVDGVQSGTVPRQPTSAAEASKRRTARSVSHNDVSSKVYQVDGEDEFSERSSTTDLEISGPKWLDRTRTEMKPKTAQSKNTGNTDVTLLSFMDSLDIANLRKMLEEERAASHRQSKADAETGNFDRGNLNVTSSSSRRRPSLKNPMGRNDDMPTKHSTASRHRKGASVDPTKDIGDDLVKTDNTQQETSHSILSNTSRRRRRRSAPVELTSAFTVPDLLDHTKAAEANFKTGASSANQQHHTQPSEIPHEPKDCTICRPDAPIPSAVPVNEHPLPNGTVDNEIGNDNDHDASAANAAAIDTTLRPAQPPLEALSYVLKIISDEITHLKLELRTAETAYSSLDPAIGQRKRKALHSRICKLLSAIEARSEMLYKLHDVLEGVKDAGDSLPHGGGVVNGSGSSNRDSKLRNDAAAAKAFAAAGKEAEHTLASLGFDIANIEDLRRRTRKSVTIAEAETRRAYAEESGNEGGNAKEDEDDDEGDDGASDEDDGFYDGAGVENTGTAPWEGIADEYSGPMEMVTG